MQLRGTLRHLCLYTYIVGDLVIIIDRRICFIYILSFSITFLQALL